MEVVQSLARVLCQLGWSFLGEMFPIRERAQHSQNEKKKTNPNLDVFPLNVIQIWAGRESGVNTEHMPGLKCWFNKFSQIFGHLLFKKEAQGSCWKSQKFWSYFQLHPGEVKQREEQPSRKIKRFLRDFRAFLQSWTLVSSPIHWFHHFLENNPGRKKPGMRGNSLELL